MPSKKDKPVLDTQDSQNDPLSYLKGMFLGLGIGFLTLIAVIAVYLFFHSPAAVWLGGTLDNLFALSSQEGVWYLTRAAGLMAYFLLWLSTIWGLAVVSKIFDRLLHRSFTFNFHEFLSLLSIGFLGLHVLVLTADQYLPYSMAQILVPFLSPYRPLWVGLGVIAFYFILLVTITFYLKNKIGIRTFKAIHVLSLLGYLGAVVHAFFSGTESTLLITRFMYGGTFLGVVFLFSYWLITYRQRKTEPKVNDPHIKSNPVPVNRLLP
jgi:predicted ferric reductase